MQRVTQTDAQFRRLLDHLAPDTAEDTRQAAAELAAATLHSLGLRVRARHRSRGSKPFCAARGPQHLTAAEALTVGALPAASRAVQTTLPATAFRLPVHNHDKGRRSAPSIFDTGGFDQLPASDARLDNMFITLFASLV